MLCAIWYHLCYLKNVKNTHGGVLLLKVKLLCECFSRFLNCANDTKSRNVSHTKKILLFFGDFMYFIISMFKIIETALHRCSYKRCFENMQQIYRRTPMPKCDFNKVALQSLEITLRHGCSPVNLLHIFKTPFSKNISGSI